MGQINNSKRFAEMERLMGDYFSCHVVPVMQQTKDDLLGKQADELRDYSFSLAGILSSMASADKPTVDPYQLNSRKRRRKSKSSRPSRRSRKPSVLPP